MKGQGTPNAAERARAAPLVRQGRLVQTGVIAHYSLGTFTLQRVNWIEDVGRM